MMWRFRMSTDHSKLFMQLFHKTVKALDETRTVLVKKILCISAHLLDDTVMTRYVNVFLQVSLGRLDETCSENIERRTRNG